MSIKSNNTHRKSFDISKNRRKWTDDEIKILQDNYSKMPINDLLSLLPNRNVNMIMNQARRLGLISFIRNQQMWKEDEIQYLRDN